MFSDEEFCRAMRIQYEPITPEPPCSAREHVAVEIRPADEPGYVQMTEDHCWALLDANRRVSQLAEDRMKTLTCWVERARESDQAMRQWRRAFCVLAAGVGAAVMLQSIEMIR